MGDYLIMSKKELKRKTLLEADKHGKLSLIECAQRLDLCYRQMKRVWARYLEEEDQGLCHRNRGKQPHNTYPAAFKSQVIAQYEKKYVDFGPTFAAEKLLEDDGIAVNKETLRLWLKDAGLCVKKRKVVTCRERRQRRARFGELLQIDGSIHHWFGDERQDCLLNMVDDATGITFALMDTGETTRILLLCLKRWIELYKLTKNSPIPLAKNRMLTENQNPTEISITYSVGVISENCVTIGASSLRRIIFKFASQNQATDYNLP